MDQLREELKSILEDTTYDKLAAIDSTLQDSTKKVLENVPAGIFVGQLDGAQQKNRKANQRQAFSTI